MGSTPAAIAPFLLDWVSLMKKEWYEYLDGDHPEPWHTTFAVILAVGLGIIGLIWLRGF